MPIAFKEWAVTVRALAEGEQLVTLRKGGIREEEKHFEVEYDRFFLYPTFDHQRNDLVRESHHPELRRALEEGVWPDEEPPPRALLQDGGIAQPDRVRIRSWAEVADHFETTTRASSTAFPHSTSGRRTTRTSGCGGSGAIRFTCSCCGFTASRARSPFASATSTTAAARGSRSIASSPSREPR